MNNDSPFLTPVNKLSPLGGDFDAANRIAHPSQVVSIPVHTIAIDSRERNCKVYPSPSYYKIPIGDVYKNITSLELKGSVIPRTSYNIHSTNNYIDFSVGDSITEIKITNGGSGYITPPNVTISAPFFPGTQATATAIIDPSSKTVVSIVVVIPGSGYSNTKPAFIYIDKPTFANSGSYNATAEIVVGTHYSAKLRVGEYSLGGNPVPPATSPTGILAEIQNAMNYAVNGAPYDPTSTSPFAVRAVNQYPELGATVGTPEAFNTNATKFNRIQITNVNNDYWELLFCTGKHKEQSSYRVLGYQLQNQYQPTATLAVTATGGELIPAGMTLRGMFDYNLTDIPTYVIMSFWADMQPFERLESSDESLNMKFATLVFDATQTDVIKNTSADTANGGSIENIGNIDYLIGSLGKGTFYTAPGTLRPLKGFDFDQKKILFNPPLSKFGSIGVQFSKQGPGGTKAEIEDFHGEEHLLIFEITASDQQTGRRS